VAKVGTSNPDRTISLEGCSAKEKKKNNNNLSITLRLYKVVTIHFQRAAYYTGVHRVYSPEEDPVSCFRIVPVSWLVYT
jgi:hypothetical protein